MFKIDNTKRIYTSLKFFRTIKFDHKHYETLVDKEEYHKLKELFEPYIDEMLHVIATYFLVTKILLFCILPLLILKEYILFGILFILLLIAHQLIKKTWGKYLFIRSVELYAIDMGIHEKYNPKKRQ